MFFDYRAFWLAKDPLHADDYQDAYAVDPVRGLAAIADGVSASLFAARWADILARAAVNEPPDVHDPAIFARVARELSRPMVAPRRRGRSPLASAIEIARRRLLDVALDSIERGYIARVPVGAIVDARGPDIWLEAQAVGDSCLFHVRQNRLCAAFPLGCSQEFGADPSALGSVGRHHDPQLPFKSLAIECRSGDVLVLATDAVAAWALAQGEAGHPPDWDACWRMSESGWRKWVTGLRRDQLMRYDDATAVILRLGAGAATKPRRRWLGRSGPS